MKKITILLLLITQIIHAQNKVYIDPSEPLGGDGTIENPLNMMPSVQSNTTYYLKSGGELSLITISAIGKENITFTTYGGTERFKINASGTDGNKVFDCNSVNVVVENIEIDGNGERSPFQTMGTYVKCDNILIRNCKFYDFVSGIRAFSTTNLTVENCEIFDIAEDGMFISHCDYVTLLNNNIYKVNQLFFSAGTSQKDAPGDGIQLEPVKNWTVIGNHIDRSDTGNKFAFIANNRDSAGAKIFQNNVLTGPYDAGSGGAIMYITGAADSVDISGNTFIMSNPDKPLSGLWQTVKNANIHDNLFVDCSSSLISNDAVFNNNKSCGIKMNTKPYHAWAGNGVEYIGNCPDNARAEPVQVDTTADLPSVDTGTNPSIPPADSDFCDTVYINNYIHTTDTVYINKNIPELNIIRGKFWILKNGEVYGSYSTDIYNAIERAVNSKLNSLNDTIQVKMDNIKIELK